MKLPALMIAGLKEIFIYSLLKLQSIFYIDLKTLAFAIRWTFF